MGITIHVHFKSNFFIIIIFDKLKNVKKICNEAIQVTNRFCSAVKKIPVKYYEKTFSDLGSAV